MFTISPSLYSADLLDLREVIGKLKGFEHLHLDIDDGNFVRGISFGMEVVKGVAECTEIPLDAHLEVLNPMEYVEPLCEAGVEMICAHSINSQRSFSYFIFYHPLFIFSTKRKQPCIRF